LLLPIEARRAESLAVDFKLRKYKRIIPIPKGTVVVFNQKFGDFSGETRFPENKWRLLERT
jgi:hypothetical protein